MEFKKNELINEILANYYATFSRTLDTSDFVPEKYNKKILKFIFKHMKKQFRKVRPEYKAYLKQIKAAARKERWTSQKVKFKDFTVKLFSKFVRKKKKLLLLPYSGSQNENINKEKL